MENNKDNELEAQWELLRLEKITPKKTDDEWQIAYEFSVERIKAADKPSPPSYRAADPMASEF